MYGFYFKVLQRSVTNPLTVVIASRVSLIAADLIVIVVTWFTTYKIASARSRDALNHNQTTFSGLLLRDGTLYFM